MRLISIEGAVVARAEVVTRRHTQNELASARGEEKF